MASLSPSASLTLTDPPLITTAPGVETWGSWFRAGRVRRTRAALEAPGVLDASGLEGVGRAALLVACRLAQGDLSAAETAGQALAEPAADGEPRAAGLALYAFGELAIAQGRTERAVDHYLAAGSAFAALPGSEADTESVRVPWRAGAVLALLGSSRRREAHPLACEHHELAVRVGDDHDHAVALRALAAADIDGSRTPRLREAALLATGSERLWAQVATDLGGLLLLEGHQDEALALLREAERFAIEEELWPLNGRIRRHLDRLGATPRRLPDETMSVLTAAERRVTRLAAAGLTNRQAAERLGVSIKAVEGHLSSVYRKLGVSSRSALLASIGS